MSGRIAITTEHQTNFGTGVSCTGCLSIRACVYVLISHGRCVCLNEWFGMMLVRSDWTKTRKLNRYGVRCCCGMCYWWQSTLKLRGSCNHLDAIEASCNPSSLLKRPRHFQVSSLGLCFSTCVEWEFDDHPRDFQLLAEVPPL